MWIVTFKRTETEIWDCFESWILNLELLFYKALQCPHQFVGHPKGITVDAEIRSHVYGFEVKAQHSIVSAGDADVASVKDARIAFPTPGQHFREGVVLLPVAPEHACVILVNFCYSVCAQESLNIHAQVCIAD